MFEFARVTAFLAETVYEYAVRVEYLYAVIGTIRDEYFVLSGDVDVVGLVELTTVGAVCAECAQEFAR